jgi:hypothetical protein
LGSAYASVQCDHHLQSLTPSLPRAASLPLSLCGEKEGNTKSVELPQGIPVLPVQTIRPLLIRNNDVTLQEEGISVAMIHGDLEQRDRELAIKRCDSSLAWTNHAETQITNDDAPVSVRARHKCWLAHPWQREDLT